MSENPIKVKRWRPYTWLTECRCGWRVLTLDRDPAYSADRGRRHLKVSHGVKR